MPQPSSTTWIRLRPPSLSVTSIRRAPASMAFSTSSLTTEAGRSTTSPAAIWFARSLASRAIFPTSDPTLAPEYFQHQHHDRQHESEDPPELRRGSSRKMREFDVHPVHSG